MKKRTAILGVLMLGASPLCAQAQRSPEIAPADNLLLSLPKVDPTAKTVSTPKETKKTQKINVTKAQTAPIATKSQPTATVKPLSTSKLALMPQTAKIETKTAPKTETKSATKSQIVSPLPSASTAKALPASPVLETKPDLPGTPLISGDASAKLSGVKPRESSLSAINDGGRMVIYLFPLLFGVVGAIRLLAKYQERKGRLPAVFATIAARAEDAKVMRTDRVKTPKPRSGGLFSALVGNFNLANAQERRTGAIKLIESVPLGGANLHLVEIRGRSILIGATSGAITVLSEFKDAQEEEDARFRTLLEEAATNLDGLEINSFGESSLLMVGSLEEELRDASASLERSAQRLQAIR